MADNTQQQPNQDYIQELLSPYIDGEVSDEERILVEQAVAASPELRQEFESLRQTVELVTALPPVAAPRPFTLSAADVQPAARESRRLFRLPAWAGGVAMVAAALLCVVVAGGLFFGSQYGSQQASEVARLDQSVQATTQLQKEAAPAAEAPMAAEAEAPAEEAMEEAVEEESAEESAADALEEKVVVEAEAEKSQIDQETDDTNLLTGQAESTESDEAEPDTGQDAAAGAAPPPPTASPLPTMTIAPLATPTLAATPVFGSGGESAMADAQEQAAPAPAESEGEAPAAQLAPAESNEAPTDLAAAEEAAKAEASSDQTEDGLAFRQELARQVEIREQVLQVQPGLIQIQGVIEAEPGTVLVASLQRNQNPFDEWANPATIQGVVQAGGRFVLNIEANANRADRDLFAQEPAGYQITIISIDEEAPVVAVVQFDTSPPAATATQSPATPTTEPPTVTPTNTPAPQPTVAPSLTPIPVQPTTPPQPATKPWQTTQWLLVGVSAFALLFAVIIGIIVWLIINKGR